MAGDPRQTLPIVKRGNRAAIVNACIQFSPLYPKMKKCILTENMRTDVEEKEFTEYLLRVGEGKEEVFEDLGEFTVKIPEDYLVNSPEHLINATFPSLGSIEMESSHFIQGTIYTPLNVNANIINEKCLKKLPGEEKIYLSADKIIEDYENEDFPKELLNTISLSGLPDHELIS